MPDEQLSAMVRRVVDDWCPKGSTFDHEPYEVRLMRAFLTLHAYMLDQRRVLANIPPVRPLDSYPVSSFRLDWLTKI